MADYEVVLARSARKELDRLTDKASDRIVARLEDMQAGPRPVGSLKLSGSNMWRLRVGDYRIIYEIDDAKKIVDILVIQHRKDVYRGL